MLSRLCCAKGNWYMNTIKNQITFPCRNQYNKQYIHFWRSRSCCQPNVKRFYTRLLISGTIAGILWKKTQIANCSHVTLHDNINNIIIKEEKSRKFIWNQFFELLKSEIWLILGSITAALVAAYINVRIPLCLGDYVNIISDIINNSEQIVLSRFKEPSIRLLTLYFGQAACTFAYISILSKLGENIAVKLKCNLFEAIIRQDIAFFDEIRTSTLVDCLTSDVQEFKSTFKQSISKGIRSTAQVVGNLTSLFIISPTMTLSIFVVVPIMILMGTAVGTVLRGISHKAQKKTLEASTIFEETVSNIRTVRAFANETNECSKFKTCLQESERLNVLLGCGIGLFQAGTNICLNTLVLGTLYLGCHLMSVNHFTPGDLMSFLVATQAIRSSFAQLSLLYGHSIKGKEALVRIFYYCNLVPKIPIAGGIIIESGKFSPNIVFENVKFSYPTRPEQCVLNDVNITIPAGKTIAVVGMSGNGKTTVANLLERFYDVNNGRILISNEDIRRLNPNWLRSSVIGIINQEPVLFAMTIKENIRYGKPTASEEEVYEAAKQANAHEFIESFPDGYNTVLGERGITISGGQKQRIAIARALIKNPSILILDEATSALDAESEKIVQNTLDEISHNRTVLIIAHRLTTVQNADIIVVLNKGKIAEMGTHKTLCAKKGLYWELMNQPNSEK